MMNPNTYAAAWRLLDMLGNDRGPILSRAAAEFRACLLREQVMEESKPPAENPYFLANPNISAPGPEARAGG